MVKYIVHLLITVLVIASCAAADKGLQQASDSEPLPLLHIQPEVYDLGDIKEGDAAVATFLVRNNSQQMIELVDIQTSCGCTAAQPDSFVVLPGNFTRLKVTVDTTAKQKGIKKTVHLTDSLGHKAKATLTFNVVENPHMSAAQKQKGIFEGQCASCHADPLRDKETGPDIFQAGCAMCHGADAAGNYAPGLRGFKSLASLKHVISNGIGRPQMPGFAQEKGGPLTQEQIDCLAAWLMGLPEKVK